MMKVDDIVRLFHTAKFVQMVFCSRNRILLTVSGCLHGLAESYFGPYCESATWEGAANPPDDAEDNAACRELWTLVPKADMRQAFCDVLVAAWRHYTDESLNPLLTFGNVTAIGWGVLRDHQTGEQVKLVLQLLVLGHSVRVYHDQDAARAAAYGPKIAADEGFIALDIDGRVYLCSPLGYLHQTRLGASVVNSDSSA